MVGVCVTVSYLNLSLIVLLLTIHQCPVLLSGHVHRCVKCQLYYYFLIRRIALRGMCLSTHPEAGSQSLSSLVVDILATPTPPQHNQRAYYDDATHNRCDQVSFENRFLFLSPSPLTRLLSVLFVQLSDARADILSGRTCRFFSMNGLVDLHSFLSSRVSQPPSRARQSGLWEMWKDKSSINAIHLILLLTPKL